MSSALCRAWPVAERFTFSADRLKAFANKEKLTTYLELAQAWKRKLERNDPLSSGELEQVLVGTKRSGYRIAFMSRVVKMAGEKAQTISDANSQTFKRLREGLPEDDQDISERSNSISRRVEGTQYAKPKERSWSAPGPESWTTAMTRDDKSNCAMS